MRDQGDRDSVQFFDRQFRSQIQAQDYALNPFEAFVLPHLAGEVLDLGCGLGNLAIEAARLGRQVTALDASGAAIERLQSLASSEALPLRALQADLRVAGLERAYDSIVSIGLLMFFDCATASRVLRGIQQQVRPGGTAAINLLVEGTTYMAMFGHADHCLLAHGELATRFAGWDIVAERHDRFDAPGHTLKCFDTVVARKPPMLDPA